MIRVARGATLGCCAVVLAACSSGGTATAEPTAPPTTALAPASTTPSSTSGAPPTTLGQRQQDEAEIRQLHDRFFEVINEIDNPPHSGDPALAATTTGIEQQRLQEYVQSLAQAGQHAEGRVSSTIIELRFPDRDHAFVRVCTASNSVRMGPDRRVIDRDREGTWVTGLEVLRTAEGWRVEDWLTGGDRACTP